MKKSTIDSTVSTHAQIKRQDTRKSIMPIPVTNQSHSIHSFITLTFIVSLVAIFTMNASHASPSRNSFLQSYANATNIKSEHIPIIYQAEQNSSPGGRAVLAKARTMALEQRAIIKGNCWNYLNTVFNRAGVKKDTVFTGAKHGGEYYNVDNIQPGDWLYYINHSYHGNEHSGMFVGWVDRSKTEALILSYAGENRHEPARYKVYDIRSVYNVMRPRATNQTTISTQAPKINRNQVSIANNKSRNVRQAISEELQQPVNLQNNSSYADTVTQPVNSLDRFMSSYQRVNNIKSSHIPLVHQAEKNSSPAGQTILRQARVMTLDNQEIITGSSRNYIKSVFERANMNYKNIFVGDYHGDYINPHQVQAGDWISYINHSYNDSEHSGIFVGWTDKPSNQALILSYGGENRHHPARYRIYDISNIYHVRRAEFH